MTDTTLASCEAHKTLREDLPSPDESLVQITVTIPESTRAELLAALQEILTGRRTRLQALEQHRASIQVAAMRGLEALAQTLERHQGTGQATKIARFLGALYNGYEYSFDLIDLRCLDTDLANACLNYLNFDRLMVKEVHEYLPGGGKQLQRWLNENGVRPKRLGSKK